MASHWNTNNLNANVCLANKILQTSSIHVSKRLQSKKTHRHQQSSNQQGGPTWPSSKHLNWNWIHGNSMDHFVFHPLLGVHLFFIWHPDVPTFRHPGCEKNPPAAVEDANWCRPWTSKGPVGVFGTCAGTKQLGLSKHGWNSRKKCHIGPRWRMAIWCSKYEL